MSLTDKLKPASKQPGLGKVAPCKRCGADAEHYGPNYVHCARCDVPKPHQKSTGAGELDLDDLGDFGEKTDPWGTLPHGTEMYKCTICFQVGNYLPAEVANGLTCPRKLKYTLAVCDGILRRYP